MKSGCPTVLIGNQRSSRVNDKATCGAPQDKVAVGEPSVLVGNQQIARMGDKTDHGGVIVQGQPNVLVGHNAGTGCMKKAAQKRSAFVEHTGNESPAAAGPGGGGDSAATPASATDAPRAIDVDRAVAHLDANAGDETQHRCGRFTREAIEAGGVTLERHTYARDYGSSLEGVGFNRVADQSSLGDYAPQRGDVIVFQPPAGRTEGHMQMYNGAQWVSDFRQPGANGGFYPGRSYRDVPFVVYRP